MLTALAILGTALAGLAVLQALDSYQWRKARKAAATARALQKHVRVTVWSDSVTIAYYSATGRKLTARCYPLNRYYDMVRSARANGYYVI